MSFENITFVTALYNLKRHELADGFKRDMSQYLEAFEKLLRHDINLVIHCDQEVADFVWKHREPKNTRVLVHDIDFPFQDRVDEIRNKESWYKQAGWLEESPQAKLQYYNSLVMSKQFYLNDASIHNYFNSNYFFWIDAGLNNTVNLEHFFTQEQFGYKLEKDVKTNKMLHLAFPYDGKVEVHGFEKKAMNNYAGKETEYVCRGGFFGGTREIINKVNEHYYRILSDTLNKGHMGTEESIFTILTYQRPDHYNVQMINANGMIGTYMHRVADREDQKDNEMAFYFLTFNAPAQLQKSLEQFRKSFPSDYEGATKYLINNTTDRTCDREYKEVIAEYDLIEHSFDNIGITGARIFAAQHFNKTDHQYMVFFEDDMVVNGTEAENKLCKCGFKRYDPDMFQKSITILEENELDYLKLTFSEFFGNNHENWAWHNMDNASKEQYLKSEFPENRARAYYTGVHKGLSYSIGEYFYCNWPILFSKEGNRKFFIDSCDDDHPESVLMGKMQRMLRKGEIKAGILLASLISHRRFKHYSKEDRVENRYKSN